jgi:hypothetical protein
MLRHVLEGEARQYRAAAAASAAGFPPTLGTTTGFRPALTGQHEHLLGAGAAVPPSLRAAASLDYTALPSGLRPSRSQSIDPAGFRAGSAGLEYTGPPSLGRASSLEYAGPPSLGRTSSLELEVMAARRAAAMGSMGYPPPYGFDQRALMLSQPAHPALQGAGSTMAQGPTGWRNLPNEGVSAQGLELLRAASVSLPNRMGPGEVGLQHAAAGAGGVGAMGGVAAMPRPKPPGFSPEKMGGAASAKKRKASEGADSDDDDEAQGTSDKIFIPEIRDLDILCGRGGKSNHHFG